MSIIDATHDHYTAHRADWQLIRRMLTGEGATRELTQRYFEHDDHFTQRKSDSRGLEPLTSYLIGRLAGMLFQRAGDVSRERGNVTDDDLEAAGVRGEDYHILLQQIAEHLLAYRTAICVLNPARGWSIVTPLECPVWTATEAVITGTTDQGGSVQEDIKQVKTWTHYTPRGYTTYIDDDGDPKAIDGGFFGVNRDMRPESADTAPPFRDASGAEIPPVLRVTVPWSVPLGLAIAKMHREIYEMQSRRDFAVSSAMNGLIQLATGGDQELADAVGDKLKTGSKYLPYDANMGEHKGLQMPVDGAELGTEIIDEKRTALRRTAYDKLEEAARQSATEAEIEHQGGAAAALSKLAETMADAEQRMLHLWNQAKDMTLDATRIQTPAQWPTDYSRVFRTSDLTRDIFRGPLPVDVETATEVVMEKLAEAGQSPDRDAIRAAVEQAMDSDTQSRSMLG